MRKHLIAVVAIAAVTSASAAFAAGKGASSPKGGMPAKSQAAANSNGIRSADRDKGLERAAERRNANSLKKNRGRNTATARKGKLA